MSLEGAACTFYSSKQSLLTWPLTPLGQKPAGTGLSACAGRRSWCRSLLPRSGGPTQVRTTPRVAFRAVVGTDGGVELGVAR